MEDIFQLHTFISSTLPWIPTDNPELSAVQELTGRFEDLFGAQLPWRVGRVTDYRNEEVLPAGEQLVRWELSDPQKVFAEGIAPRVKVNNINELNKTNADVGDYVKNNRASVFVSTSRRSIGEQGSIMGPVPSPEQVAQRFQYEIFVHGGIDVDQVGLSGHNFHADQDELEVTFPGGIRREFIRSVRIYHGSGGIHGTPEIWLNPFFNPSAIAPECICVGSLPDIADSLNIVAQDWKF
ncbi:hypothetical protein BDV93DRAFT_561107 [Ceratobasidium sp. AG-I]|nr:hypothetical protein BDV93DRAFT_561107 [Ceratobasidium sp. AG-I]